MAPVEYGQTLPKSTHYRAFFTGCSWPGRHVPWRWDSGTEAIVFDAEPYRGVARGKVAVDRPGDGHGCRGVGIPPAGRGQAGQCRAVVLVAAVPASNRVTPLTLVNSYALLAAQTYYQKHCIKECPVDQARFALRSKALGRAPLW